MGRNNLSLLTKQINHTSGSLRSPHGAESMEAIIINILCSMPFTQLTTDKEQLYVVQMQHIRAGYNHELALGIFVNFDGQPFVWAQTLSYRGDQ